MNDTNTVSLMSNLLFGVLYYRCRRVFVCVLSQDGGQILTEAEERFVQSFLAPDAVKRYSCVWDCGNDANVVARLHFKGLQPHALPTRLLRLLERDGSLEPRRQSRKKK